MRPESTYKIWNPRFQQKPEIVSFTQILKENYVVEYGTFIRGKIRSGELPVPCFGYRSLPKVQDVTIDKAYYDRLDSISFAMYVICDVRFYDPVTQQEQYQKYYVTDYHSFNGISDYLTNGEHFSDGCDIEEMVTDQLMMRLILERLAELLPVALTIGKI